MNLFTLQRKETFRAPQWEAKMSIKVVMVLITLYFLVAFVLGASFIYPGLNKAVLTKEPVEVFNSVLLYFFFLSWSCVSFYSNSQSPTFKTSSCCLSRKVKSLTTYCFVQPFLGLIFSLSSSTCLLLFPCIETITWLFRCWLGGPRYCWLP